MSDAVTQFVADLRADERFSRYADAIGDALSELDEEACTNPDGAGFYECVYWILDRPDRLLSEKLEKVCELVTRRGRQAGTIRDIVGW